MKLKIELIDNSSFRILEQETFRGRRYIDEPLYSGDIFICQRHNPEFRPDWFWRDARKPVLFLRGECEDRDNITINVGTHLFTVLKELRKAFSDFKVVGSKYIF